MSTAAKCRWCGGTHAPGTPCVPQRIEGAGDVIKKLTGFMGIQPCGGCQKRAEALNKLLPVRRRS